MSVFIPSQGCLSMTVGGTLMIPLFIRWTPSTPWNTPCLPIHKGTHTHNEVALFSVHPDETSDILPALPSGTFVMVLLPHRPESQSAFFSGTSSCSVQHVMLEPACQIILYFSELIIEVTVSYLLKLMQSKQQDKTLVKRNASVQFPGKETWILVQWQKPYIVRFAASFGWIKNNN